MGADIGTDDLTRLLPEGAEASGEPLVRAISAGLVRRDPAGTIGFSHDLFREVTYSELAEDQRRAIHRRAAEVLAAGRYRPSLVADHLLQASGTDRDAAVVAALREAVAATRARAPEVTSDLLDDVAAVGVNVPDQLLLDQVEALSRRGRGQSAGTLIRKRIGTVTDIGVAAQLQVNLILSLTIRADVTTALEVMENTAAIPGLPGPAARRLQANRASLLALAGRPLPAAGLDAILAGYVAVGDTDAQANLLATAALTAFLAGRPDQALELWCDREELGHTARYTQGGSYTGPWPGRVRWASAGAPGRRTVM